MPPNADGSSNVFEQKIYQDNISGNAFQELVRPDPVDQPEAAVVDAEQQAPDDLEDHHELHLGLVLSNGKKKTNEVSVRRRRSS